MELADIKKKKFLTDQNLALINFVLIGYFALLFLVNFLHIDHVLIGVVVELFTIPFLIAQIVFLIIGIPYIIKNKASKTTVISVVSLAIASVITIGSLFL